MIKIYKNAYQLSNAKNRAEKIVKGKKMKVKKFKIVETKNFYFNCQCLVCE